MQRVTTQQNMSPAAIVLLFVALGLTGCASLQVRSTQQYDREPHVFPATIDREKLGTRPMQRYLRELPPVFALDLWGGESALHPEVLLLGPGAWLVGTACYVAVDRPVAVISDALLYPYDRYRVSRFDEVTDFWDRTFEHDGATPLPACSELHRYNYSPYVRPALREYLERCDASRPLLLQLAKADIESPSIAASAHVDAALAERLLARTSRTNDVCRLLSKNAAATADTLAAVYRHSNDPEVLEGLAAHDKATPELLRMVLHNTNATPAVVEQIAGNVRTPDALLRELPPRYDAAVARNPAASLDTLRNIVNRSTPEQFHPYPSASAVWGVAEHPRTDGALLGDIVARHPQRLDLACRVAARRDTPPETLWKLARRNEPAIGCALARNPALPQHILGFLARHAAPRVQRILADRDAPARDVQIVLADSKDAAVQESLARNPATDPDILLALARHTSHPEPLHVLASLTNAAAEVYLAVAAKTNQPALRRLAANRAVSETVLRAVLENGDDNAARAVLRNPGAGYRTKQLALDSIGERKSQDHIDEAVLEEDTVIDGIRLRAGTAVRFYRDGSLYTGTLAADQVLDGRELRDVLYRRGGRIRLDSQGKVQTEPPLPTMIQGIMCAEEKIIRFYSSGALQEAFIAADHEIGGTVCSGGQRIYLFESGRLHSTDRAREHRSEARRLLRSAKIEQALQECEKALAVSPAYTDALNLRGFIHRTQANLRAARRDYERVVELAPGESAAYAGIAMCDYREERWDEAIRNLTRAIERDDRNLHTYLCRGMAWLAKGEFQRARDDFEYAARPHPIFAAYLPAVNTLAWFLATCPAGEFRDGERALTLAQKAVTQNRTGPHLDTLAAAYAELGHFKRAIATQREALLAASPTENASLHAAFEERLAAYRAKRPWRDETAVQ